MKHNFKIVSIEVRVFGSTRKEVENLFCTLEEAEAYLAQMPGIFGIHYLLLGETVVNVKETYETYSRYVGTSQNIEYDSFDECGVFLDGVAYLISKLPTIISSKSLNLNEREGAITVKNAPSLKFYLWPEMREMVTKYWDDEEWEPHEVLFGGCYIAAADVDEEE